MRNGPSVLAVLQHALPAMLLAIQRLDYNARLAVHKGKPQLLLMHRYFFALAIELASQTSIICIAMCDAIPDKFYPERELFMTHTVWYSSEHFCFKA